jgi:hypothetical protein
VDEGKEERGLNKMKIRCIHCAESFDVPVEPEDYRLYRLSLGDGALIQNAMPCLTPDQRELLISGYCDKCFQAICFQAICAEEDVSDLE